MAVRILIVDDEPNIIGTVAPLLRARGYDVTSAMNGVTALAAVERNAPELIVLDLGLPDIDGVEVCRRVRDTMSIVGLPSPYKGRACVRAVRKSRSASSRRPCARSTAARVRQALTVSSW